MRKKRIAIAVLVFLVLSFYAVASAEDLIPQDVEGGNFDPSEEFPIDFEEDEEIPEEDMGIISGLITGINVGTKRLTIKSDEGGTKTLVVDPEMTMLWKGEDMVELGGLAIGDMVDASYIRDDDGKLIIEWVEVIPEDMRLPMGVQME